MTSAPIPELANYDLAFDWTARMAREGPFLRAALSRAPSRRIVDLGSGTGEHARWLAASGFEVVAIEGVPERWRAARERPAANVEFLVGDFGAVEMMVRGRFGAALCLGNGLPALIGAEAVSRMFVGLRRRLEPGGCFILQQWNYDGLVSRDVRSLPERRLPLPGGGLVFRSRLAFEEDGIVAVTETAFSESPDGGLEPRPKWDRQRWLQGWRYAELMTLLDVAQFRQVASYGGFAGEPFDLDLSDELVLVAS